MNTYPWQLTTPLDAIVFDCDGTLSRVEGINALADLAGVSDEVAELTEYAMSHGELNENLYEQRLELVKPTRANIRALAELYYEDVITYLADMIKLFTQINKPVFVISAGIQESVELYAGKLAIQPEHVFAVNVYHDENGFYQDFDRESPLIHGGGKREILQQIKKEHPRVALIGDGNNDLSAKQEVQRFIGFGGAYYREKIEQNSDFYIYTDDMSPLAWLTLTATEIANLPKNDHGLIDHGLDLINHNKVLIR